MMLNIFFSFIYISWRLITLQYCSGFCRTLVWLSHGFTCAPHLDEHFLICLFAICIFSLFPFVEHFIGISLFHTHAHKKTFFLRSYYFSPFLMGACPLRIFPVEWQSYLWETLIIFLFLLLHKSLAYLFLF